jgi:geranylgeranyl diphosphate synthase type II
MACQSTLADHDERPAPVETGRIERTLELALRTVRRGQGPARLAAAMHDAVFPGGHRLRPQLALLVARACGDPDPASADAAAAAVELIHCASLVHDDLPCFDDADVRRGRPSVHKVWGEPLALLAGDALIVLAFDVLARWAPARVAPLVLELATAAGGARGIAAGQAWETERAVDVLEYHRAKTASLFEAAAAMGALAAGADPGPWRRAGDLLGRAYQAADDIADAVGEQASLGKPTGRDALLGRPSLVRAEGIAAARACFDALVDQALDAVPTGGQRTLLQTWIRGALVRLAPAPTARNGTR